MNLLYNVPFFFGFVSFRNSLKELYSFFRWHFDSEYVNQSAAFIHCT